MATYKLCIVKKFYEPFFEVEADSAHEAEEKAYEWLEANNQDGKYNSDDTYIYNNGVQ